MARFAFIILSLVGIVTFPFNLIIQALFFHVSLWNTLLGFVLVWIVTTVYAWTAKLKLRHIPGPEPPLFEGHFFQRQEMIDERYFYRDLYQKYGVICKAFQGREPYVIINDPELVKQIGFKLFPNFTNRARLPGGRKTNSVAFLRDERWRRVRNAMIPLFHDRNLREFLQPIDQTVFQLISLLNKQIETREDSLESLDITTCFSNMTMQVIGLTIFGVDFGALSGDKCRKPHPIVESAGVWTKHFQPKSDTIAAIIYCFPFLRPLLVSLAPKLLPDLFHHLAVLDAVSLDLVKKRQADPNKDSYNDCITFLLKCQDKETGEYLNEIEIRDQMNTFLVAGYETTAGTLSFATLLLSQHPDAQAKLLEEIDRLAPRGTKPDYDQLKEFKYAEAVLNETLRVFPMAQTAREAGEDTVVGGYLIPKGTNISLTPYAVYHDPQYYANPDQFLPERFLEESEEQQRRPKTAFLPFGLGPRMCVGSRFAMEEAKYALIRVYQHFYFTADPVKHKNPVKVAMGIVMSPVNGIWLTPHHRS